MYDWVAEIENLLDLSFSQTKNMAPANEKLGKLNFARKRLLSELNHTITAVNQKSLVSKKMLIVCKDRALDKYWADFQNNLKEIIEAREDDNDCDTFFTENQEIEDKYHLAKVHLDSILPEDDDPNQSIDRSFFGQANNTNNNNNHEYKGHIYQT